MTITVSYLRHMYFHRGKNRMDLHQSKITDWRAYDTWPEFVEGFLDLAVYPTEPSNKYETYGWTPTLFQSSANKHGEWGLWRDGDYVADTLSLFIADLDNQHDDRTMVSIDAMEDTMRHLGLSYMLYTSYTHSPERHKVRIVCPVSRDITPDEAFRIFTWFNYAFDYQLDGSVYDPGDHLYGPPPTSDIRHSISGAPLDVDRFLALAEKLPEEAKTFVTRSEHRAARRATPEEIAQAERLIASLETTEGVTIRNPKVFRPEWLDLLHQRYRAGSRNQSVLGLLTKAWIKSNRSLTKGDLLTLQREMDAELGGYLARTYGRAAMERDVVSVMQVVPTEIPANPVVYDRHADLKQRMMEKEMSRLARLKKNNDDNV